jgi:hypothetical protein
MNKGSEPAVRHSGPRVSANPESRNYNLRIPGSGLRLAPE